MGKKWKEEGQETYEVWILRDNGEWMQVQERGNQGIFQRKQRALLIAGSKTNEKGVVEILVIERRPIVSFNGPSISLKGRLSAALDGDEKKEETYADGVHGDRREADQIVDPGPGREGQTGVRRLEGEADPS